MTDRLLTGQRLQVNGRLVSANGTYTLVLQEDGNLVLYEEPATLSSAYWSSDTWWMESVDRPTSLLMQDDAHLVLYNDSGVARWASGTWGLGYVEPHVVLQNDGNLVVYHGGSRPIWASGRPGGADAIRARGRVPAGDLNGDVDGLGRMPLVVSGSSDLSAPTNTTVDANGVAYEVTEQRRRQVNDIVEQSFLQDIAGMGVWPGQTIQAKALLVGDVAPIGPLPRQPGVIEIVTDLISGTPQSQNVHVTAPDAAAANQARRGIVNSVNPTDAPGQLRVDFQRASTLREVGVKLGVTVKGSAFGVDANATLDQTYKQSTVVATIRQAFYLATFTPDAPRAGGFWSPADVSFEDLTPFVGAGNPPLYIDSVQYGRFICVTVQGSFSSSELTGALKAHWQATVSGNVDISGRTKEILDNCAVKIYTLGVPGHAGFQNILDPISELQAVYTAGARFSPANPGAPISFTCRHVADNTLAHVGLVAEYTAPLTARGPDVSQRAFPVFDGPGGGLVDTRIPVNPGDSVTVSAKDQIWSGVVFSAPHGPEGWPGHRADRAAPLPTGTAYCLLLRFGVGEWIEAGGFWQGSPPAGNGGVLQLNINDNNPHNGDPGKRWNVIVDVKRAPAAAVGIYA